MAATTTPAIITGTQLFDEVAGDWIFAAEEEVAVGVVGEGVGDGVGEGVGDENTGDGEGDGVGDGKGPGEGPGKGAGDTGDGEGGDGVGMPLTAAA